MALRRPVAALAVLLLAGCGSREAAGPGDVRVEVGAQDVTVRPVQYCQDGERVRYENTPPVIEVSPDAGITLTVPESVAERGWAVQVFDEALEEILGEVDVPAGDDQLTEINTSDVVPPGFYLVIVEDKGGDCGEWSGAWPVGFLRAG
ncbi:MAG TPA: DUF2771 family protein [Blastococcus sp.]|nr:DUF2771 family protein [Blastococcus sp.]